MWLTRTDGKRQKKSEHYPNYAFGVNTNITVCGPRHFQLRFRRGRRVHHRKAMCVISHKDRYFVITGDQRVNTSDASRNISAATVRLTNVHFDFVTIWASKIHLQIDDYWINRTRAPRVPAIIISLLQLFKSRSKFQDPWNVTKARCLKQKNFFFENN